MAHESIQKSWPPTREDLEELYLRKHLSAAAIATVYGLQYASAKTAESTVLYHLKRNGIKRRGTNDHQRHPTKEAINSWVRRYRAGESLKQIAGSDSFSPVTVWHHLKREKVEIRDKLEALIKATTKHVRTPFTGDLLEKSYLLGLARGDLYVTTHGRAVRVRLSTTHPAMENLFASLFKRYGPIYKYPKKSNITGFEWSLDADLDSSFAFLRSDSRLVDATVTSSKGFFGFLSGFFDAEGTIYLHLKHGGYSPELAIANTDLKLLEWLQRGLRIVGIESKIASRVQQSGRGGGFPQGNISDLRIWRFVDVHRALSLMSLGHLERVWKKSLVLGLTFPPNSQENIPIWREWEQNSRKDKIERDSYVNLAKSDYEGRRARKDENVQVSGGKIE